MKLALLISLSGIFLGACTGAHESISKNDFDGDKSILVCSRRFNCEAETFKLCNSRNAQLIYSKQYPGLLQKIWADSLVQIRCI